MPETILEPTKGEEEIIRQLLDNPDVKLDKNRFHVRRTASRICFTVEHGDYNGTDLFGAAIGVKPEGDESNGFIWLAYQPRTDGVVHIKSLNYPHTIADFSLGKIPDPSKIDAKYPWTKFPMGVDFVLRSHGHQLTTGLEGVLIGKIPEGGLSRSASLTLNLMLSLLEVNGIDDVDGMKMVDMAQQVENDYIHSPCGKLDQAMIYFGKKGKGTIFSQRNRTIGYVDLPVNAEPVEVIVFDTGTKRAGLQSTDYEKRQEECITIVNAYGSRYRFKQLADVTLGMYDSLMKELCVPDWKARLKYVFEAKERYTTP